MKFGKEFSTHLEETLPEWRDKFLCYKPLKKLLKTLSDDGADHPPPPPDWFINILTEELEKFNDFYVDKEEDFVIRLQELKGRIERLREKRNRNGVFASEAEFSEEMMDIRKDFVSIHGEMVLLKNYSSLNFAGLIKILKKYDKRTGGLLQLPFTQLVLNQPFFTTEPLTRLVHECEANLELLFPLEEEVVQSANEATDSSGATSSPHREDTTDIYRSTLAAMKTIQGLKKESSTENPLSFRSIFGKQDSETGAVTAENSPNDAVLNADVANLENIHPPK